MTAQHKPFVPDDQRASGLGATGGLPGANADPRASEVTPEEIESTVAAGDMPGDAAPTRPTSCAAATEAPAGNPGDGGAPRAYRRGHVELTVHARP